MKISGLYFPTIPFVWELSSHYVYLHPSWLPWQHIHVYHGLLLMYHYLCIAGELEVAREVFGRRGIRTEAELKIENHRRKCMTISFGAFPSRGRSTLKRVKKGNPGSQHSNAASTPHTKTKTISYYSLNLPPFHCTSPLLTWLHQWFIRSCQRRFINFMLPVLKPSSNLFWIH